MKNVKSILGLMSIVLAFVFSTNAQMRGHGPLHGDSGRFGAPPQYSEQIDSNNSVFRQRRDRLKKLKIWKMVEYLNLSSSQSEKFFPRYHQYEDRLRKHREKRQKLIAELDKKLNQKNYEPGGTEFQKYFNKFNELKEERIQLKKEFLKDVEKLLNIKQKMKLLIFEDKFRREIMNELHRMRRKGKQHKFRR